MNRTQAAFHNSYGRTPGRSNPVKIPTTLFVSTDRHNDIIIQVHYTDGTWQEFTASPSDIPTEIDLTIPTNDTEN